jgi:hypothetical protein
MKSQSLLAEVKDHLGISQNQATRLTRFTEIKAQVKKWEIPMKTAMGIARRISLPSNHFRR